MALDLTRSSSAAPSGSATGCLQWYFNHDSGRKQAGPPIGRTGRGELGVCHVSLFTCVGCSVWLDLSLAETLILARASMIILSGCINKPSRQLAVWMSKRDQPLASVAAPVSGHNTRLAPQDASVAYNFDRGFA
jgi:hypothetical protein